MNLPILSRPSGLLGPRRAALDTSVGGISVYVDDPLRIGTRLEIEMLLPERDSLTVDVRVSWCQSSTEAWGGYEAGLEFLTMGMVHRTLLERCLARHAEPQAAEAA